MVEFYFIQVLSPFINIARMIILCLGFGKNNWK